MAYQMAEIEGFYMWINIYMIKTVLNYLINL